MFPSIDTQQRLVLANNRILVSVRADANLACLRILNKPCPATALDPRQRSIELLLHLIETAVCAVDGLGQTSRGRVATSLVLRCEVFPEQAVVDVPAAVEVDERL
jgi:hypothetical protein